MSRLGYKQPCLKVNKQYAAFVLHALVMLTGVFSTSVWCTLRQPGNRRYYLISFERTKRGSRMSLDGTMPIGGIELPPGFEFLFRSWCTSVYATLHLRKEILQSQEYCIIAVERTVGADRRKTELCVLQHDSVHPCRPGSNAEGIFSYR